jgi:hypothetical protein
MTELEQNLNYILTEKEHKILPNNIKEGIKIFDVIGTMKEYIEFEKLQYIIFGTDNCLDTSYPLWKSKNWAIEYKISFSSLYNYNHLFSVSESDTKNEIWVDSAGQLNIRLTNETEKVTTATVFEANTEYSIKHKCVEDTITTYINDQVVNTYDCSLGLHPGLNLRFGRRTSGGQFVGNLYYLKLYDNNVLVKDFIPAIDKIDGKAMMYETLSKQYYKSMGNSEFTAGQSSTEIDTSDATATSSDILEGKIAYSKDQRIVGTLTLSNEYNAKIGIPTAGRGIHWAITEISDIDTSTLISTTGLFSDCKNLKKITGELNLQNSDSMYQMFNNCSVLESVDNITNTQNVLTAYQCFYSCFELKTVQLLDFSKVNSLNNLFSNASKITNLGGFKDLGKGYTQKTANYSNYTLDLNNKNSLTHDSLMNVINNLYDLNLTYDVANGGTLYTQSLKLGSTNLAKLTASEKAIATNKGFTLS